MSSEPTMQSALAEELARVLQEADEAFVKRCADRMEMGAEKYGPWKFMEVDTVEEAMQECLDLSNYSRMMFIKLFLLQRSMVKISTAAPQMDHEGFISFADMFGRPKE